MSFIIAVFLFVLHNCLSTLNVREYHDGYDTVFVWYPTSLHEVPQVAEGKQNASDSNIIACIETSARRGQKQKKNDDVSKISKTRKHGKKKEVTQQKTKKLKPKQEKSSPTPQPTNKPTMRPTEIPTAVVVKNREQWDSSKALSRKNCVNGGKNHKKQNDDSSKKDEKYLKAAMQKSNGQKKRERTSATNSIKLYSYELPDDMPDEERGILIETFQEEMVRGGKYNLVMIKDFTKPSNSNRSVVTYVDTTDEALDRLTYVVINVLSDEQGYSAQVFNEQFATFIHVLSALDESLFHRIMDALTQSQSHCMCEIDLVFLAHIRNQYDQMKELQWALRVVEYELSEAMLGIVVRFLYIAYNELLVAKLKNTQQLITNSSYALAGKIPGKFKKEFDRFYAKHTRYVQVELPVVLKNSSMLAFNMLANYFGDFSLYAADLEIARIIFDWKQKDKSNHGTIVVSAGDLAKATDIDELLNVLGYAPETIERFKVINSHNAKGKLKTIPFVLAEKTTRITQIASEKSRRRNKKKTPVSPLYAELMPDETSIDIVENSVDLLCMTDIENAVNNQKYDALIFMDKSLRFMNLSLLSNRFNLFDEYDVAFDSMWVAMSEFTNCTSSEEQIALTVTTLFTKIIFELSKLTQRIYDFLMDSLRAGVKRGKKLVVIADIAYAHYKKIGRYESLKWIERQHNDTRLKNEMLSFVHIVLLQSSDALLKDIGKIFEKSSYGQSNRIPDRLQSCWQSLFLDAFEFLTKGLVTSINILRAPKEKLMRGINLIRANVLQMKLTASIGQIIYEWQQNDKKGMIGIGIDKSLTTSAVLYDVLIHLGYNNNTITTQDIDIEKEIQVARIVI